MSRDSITLSYKQIGAIALVVANLILIGPGGWLLKNLWSQANSFKNETKLKLDDLDKEINLLKVGLPEQYVSQEIFSQHLEEMGETIRHLDSKITP